MSAAPSPEPAAAPAAPVESGEQARRLLQLIRANRWGAPVAVPVLLWMWSVWRTPTLMAMAGLVTLTVGIQWAAQRYAERGDVERGVRAMVIGIWVPITGLAVLAPESLLRVPRTRSRPVSVACSEVARRRLLRRVVATYSAACWLG